MIPQVLVIGGGMVVREQILPSLLHLERLERVGAVTVSALRHETVASLCEAEELRRAFSAQSFRVLPGGPGERQPESWRSALAQLSPRQLIVAPSRATPSAPGASRSRHADRAAAIAEEARHRKLLAVVEYHKPSTIET